VKPPLDNAVVEQNGQLSAAAEVKAETMRESVVVFSPARSAMMVSGIEPAGWCPRTAIYPVAERLQHDRVSLDVRQHRGVAHQDCRKKSSRVTVSTLGKDCRNGTPFPIELAAMARSVGVQAGRGGRICKPHGLNRRAGRDYHEHHLRKLVRPDGKLPWILAR